jgi:DNA-binding NarL/FixJ family response regulator
MSRVLAIPLAIGPRYVSTIAVLRGGADFTTRDLELAGYLQPFLGGIYALRDRLSRQTASRPAADAGASITDRELAVLDLMADGLIAVAIARQLGISSRTVSKHIENIYRKLGTHDRTSAVLRGQALRLLPSRQ